MTLGRPQIDLTRNIIGYQFNININSLSSPFIVGYRWCGQTKIPYFTV